MNANELADYLMKFIMMVEDYDESKHEKAAAMLRQQQAEIEALKQIIDANNLNQNIGQFVKPSNEPVAWMSKKGILSYVNDMGFTIPLYTHPVKELTDEDAKQKLIRIMGTFDLATGHADTFDELLDSLKVELRDVLGYYREALRKAQEQ